MQACQCSPCTDPCMQPSLVHGASAHTPADPTAATPPTCSLDRRVVEVNRQPAAAWGGRLGRRHGLVCHALLCGRCCRGSSGVVCHRLCHLLKLLLLLCRGVGHGLRHRRRLLLRGGRCVRRRRGRRVQGAALLRCPRRQAQPSLRPPHDAAGARQGAPQAHRQGDLHIVKGARCC